MPAAKRRSRSRKITLDGESLSPERLGLIAAGAGCRLAPAARGRIRASRRTVERATRDGATVYGVNTGFGKLSRVRIDDADLGALQRNLVRSHAAGVGAPLPEPMVRAVMALRANCLARGHSGIRVETVERILELLDAGICPVIPEQGSVGASGDLAPLAHLALAVIGEGEVTVRGRRSTAARALKRAGLKPLELRAKEGLALVNGTQVMSAIGVLSLLRAERLSAIADVAGAMSLEAMLGSHRAFDRRIQQARPHPGQVTAALNLRRLLADSPLEQSHRDCGRVQDCYSLRCIPQVHGAVRDALAHVRRVLHVEINGSTDNPMVFADDDALISGGNFHGQPVALALDHLGTAVCSLGTISERRTDRLMSPELSVGLPPFLSRNAGLHSGFMLAQVTAASLVSENKVLAHPASVDSITTSASKEDHVSMGVTAARKAERIVDHVSTVLAIEALCAAQALDLRRPLRPGRGVEAARSAIRRRIPHLKEDRVLAPDIERAKRMLDDGSLRAAVEKEIGPLA
jgi:histidine ammonia-lyase